MLDVSIPTLMLSLVHMSGDPEPDPRRAEARGALPQRSAGLHAEEDKAAVRKIALEVIADYRDRGCPEPEPSPGYTREMMQWLVCEPVPDEYVPMLLEEMELDGRNARARGLGGNKADDFPVVVIGCGDSGLLAGIRLKERHPVHDHREECRRRRHVVPEHLPRRAGRRAQPRLRLQLRADRSVDTLLRRTARMQAYSST